MTPNTYEGRWICTHCGLENLGRFESCQGEGSGGCGVSRPANVRFYRPQNSPVVTDGALLDDADSGADWNCSHCDGANKNAIGRRRIVSCVHCGNGRDSEDTSHKVRRFAPGAAPATPQEARMAEKADAQDKTDARAAARQDALDRRETRTNPAPAAAAKALVTVAATLAAGLAAFLVWFFFLAAQDHQGRVAASSWSWTSSTERMITETFEGFQTPPWGARILLVEERQNGTKEIQVGTRTERYTDQEEVPNGSEPYVCGEVDLGNGYFRDKICQRALTKTVDVQRTREVPVMRTVPNMETWRRFEADRWIPARTWTTNGTDFSPFPPQTPDLMADERRKTDHRTFAIVVDLDGEQIAYTPTYEDWKRMAIGATLVVHRTRAGSVLGITLAP